MKRSTLISVTPNWMTTGGIFTALAALSGVQMPWHSYVEPLVLDIDYYGSFSGDKPISCLPRRLLNVYGQLTSLEYSTLAAVISSRYLMNWRRLWDTVVKEYDPIHNLAVTEHEAYIGNVDDTKNLAYTTDEVEYPDTTSTETRNLAGTRDSTRTPNITNAETKALTEQETRALYGTDDTKTTYADTVTETRNLQESNSSTETPNTTTVETTNNMATLSNSSNSIHGFNSSTNPVPTTSSQSSDNTSGSRTRTNTGTTSISGSSTDTGTVATAHTGYDDVDRDTSDTGTVTKSQTGTDTFKETGTDTIDEDTTDTGTVTTKTIGSTTVDRDSTETGTDNRDIDYTRDVTRSGNVGNITTQQMLEEERQLWLWNYFRQIYKDVDMVLCSALYK